MLLDPKDQQIAQLQEALLRAHKWMREPDTDYVLDAQDDFEEDVEFVELVLELNGAFDDADEFEGD